MATPAREPIAAPAGARCSLHPDRPALLACHRCGAFGLLFVRFNVEHR